MTAPAPIRSRRTRTEAASENSGISVTDMPAVVALTFVSDQL